MRKRSLFLLFLVPLFLLTTAPAQTRSITEKIEWTWADRPDHPDPKLPNILLIGDSITRAYYPETSHLLAGKANCYLFATSASSGDHRLLKQISDLADIVPANFAVIHFNNGMHGWGYTEQQYGQGLPSFLVAVRKLSPSATLIWANTTPVRKPTSAGATNERVHQRNELAMAVMKRAHVTIDDQEALMLQHQDLHQDDVHFTPAGSAIQAQQVAKYILDALSSQQKQ
ncbi:MAG TPA: SGNH/GDSL hydrolase family protein [Edaphobacter sp.]|nr:SGNH/GDSL hydrolase family protein [Edaphobacter sp.]